MQFYRDHPQYPVTPAAKVVLDKIHPKLRPLAEELIRWNSDEATQTRLATKAAGVRPLSPEGLKLVIEKGSSLTAERALREVEEFTGVLARTLDSDEFSFNVRRIHGQNVMAGPIVHALTEAFSKSKDGMYLVQVEHGQIRAWELQEKIVPRPWYAKLKFWGKS